MDDKSLFSYPFLDCFFVGRVLAPSVAYLEISERDRTEQQFADEAALLTRLTQIGACPGPVM